MNTLVTAFHFPNIILSLSPVRKARDNLLAMDAPSPGPDPSKFKLPDLDDKLLAEGERVRTYA